MLIIPLKPDQVCRSQLDRAKGLMFARRPKIVLFEAAQSEWMSIHSWFVFFPLDVYWLDSEKAIVAYERLKPFSNDRKFKAKYVLEGPTGFLKANVGDFVDWGYL